MKQHQYHVTVQHLKDAKGEVSNYMERLEFYTGNHDDIFEIVEKLKNAEFFDDQTTKSFGVGLKLLVKSCWKIGTIHCFKSSFPSSGNL